MKNLRRLFQHQFIQKRMVSALIGMLFTHPAYAYVYTVNSSGQPVKWSNPSPTFYVNWTNNSGLSYNDIFTSLTTSLQRWQNAGSTSVSFDYWQGANSGTPTVYSYDGRNAVFFSSQSSQKLGASTLGVTYVFSSGSSIVETDIEFNDENFTFTTNATDSTRFGDGSHVYLENVATHEFGHAYGLAHSAVLQSSMVYLEYRQQAHLSCDDIQGIGALYPSNAFSTSRGTISGHVKSSSIADIFGAHVLAISKTRGTVVSAVISDSRGNFSLPNLEPGDYYLFFEPFQNSAYVSSLCGGDASGCFYASMNAATACSGSPFKRGFYLNGEDLQKISVSSSNNVDIGNYTISCNNLNSGTVYSSIANADSGTAYLSNTNSSSKARALVIGNTGSTQYVKLSNVSGDIAAKAVAYNLYSPMDVQVKIVDSSDNDVAGSVSTDNVINSSDSGYKNYDSVATLSSAPAGDYYIKITNKAALAKSKYPGGFASNTQVDSVRYYALIVTIGDVAVFLPNNTSPLLTNNARCEATDGFSAFSDHGSPADSAPNANSSAITSGGGSSSAAAAGGCGVIMDASKHSSGSGPGPDALFSVWGIMMMMFAYKLLRHNRLRELAWNLIRR